MRQFKFKEWVFKNLFPFYYQKRDTYHDNTGKGILQRFTEVCSNYLDTEVLLDQFDKPGLDNILDIIDPDVTPDLFLNYLWEFLGEIPYAYGVIIQGKEYDPDTIRSWVFNNTDFPLNNQRNLLKYAISLYKIRGTEKFYKILGAFYGLDLQLVETVNGGRPGADTEVINYDHLVLATYDDSIATYARGSEEVRAPYPDGDCYSCLYYKVLVGIPENLLKEIIANGRLDKVILIIEKLVEKYLPIHCKMAKYDDGSPKVDVDGVEHQSIGDFNNDHNNDFYMA